MTYPALLQSELSGVATFFFGFFRILIIVGDSVLFTYWISRNERLVMGFAVDCTRKAPNRLGTVYDPCKRRRRRKGHYRHA